MITNFHEKSILKMFLMEKEFYICEMIVQNPF